MLKALIPVAIRVASIPSPIPIRANVLAILANPEGSSSRATESLGTITICVGAGMTGSGAVGTLGATTTGVGVGSGVGSGVATGAGVGDGVGWTGAGVGVGGGVKSRTEGNGVQTNA